MPKRFPKEFRDDVVRVARSGEPTHQEIAHDFNISLSSPKRWLSQADFDDGLKDGPTSGASGRAASNSPRDRHLDQAHLQQPTPPASSRQAHARRVQAGIRRHSGGMMFATGVRKTGGRSNGWL